MADGELSKAQRDEVKPSSAALPDESVRRSPEETRMRTELQREAKDFINHKERKAMRGQLRAEPFKRKGREHIPPFVKEIWAAE
jgi:hypothetical protein